MYFFVSKTKEIYTVLAKDEPFSCEHPVLDKEPGVVFVANGKTEAEAMHQLEISIAKRRLNFFGKMSIPMKLLSKKVKQWEVLPRYYGIAYWDYHSISAVAYPVPLNLIVRFFRWLWHESVKLRPTELDKLLRDAYEEGHKDTLDGKYNRT